MVYRHIPKRKRRAIDVGGLDDVANLDATAQAELVRSKQIKPIELVDSAIERIERLNPALNAVVTPMYEQARTAAKGISPEGPFAGVPYMLKDLLASYAGVRMTLGCERMKQYVAPQDSELVSRLKRAGLIILGKTSTPEFGLLPTTEPLLFGLCRNPWDTTRTTGGSSGGSAAVVASGMVPMAHGNDGGGSIRIPASCCGLFGLKPTRARNPLGPDFGDIYNGLVVEHAVTRSVRDSALLLDATSGPDLGDPYWAPPPVRPFHQEIGCPPDRLRIAFSTNPPIEIPVHPDCVEAVRDTARLCSELGHEVKEASPQLNGAMVQHAFSVIWAAGCTSIIDGIAFVTGQPPKAEQFELLTWGLYENGKRLTPSDYLLSWQFLQRLSRDIARFMTDYDIWLTPTLAEPPVPLGTFDSTAEEPLRGFDRAAAFVPFTPICNATGQPAMSVPLYWNADGLPVGTHFIGRFGDEATLFRLAAQLEEARPWADKKPPIWA
jgi:amidase